MQMRMSKTVYKHLLYNIVTIKNVNFKKNILGCYLNYYDIIKELTTDKYCSHAYKYYKLHT